MSIRHMLNKYQPKNYRKQLHLEKIDLFVTLQLIHVTQGIQMLQQRNVRFRASHPPKIVVLFVVLFCLDVSSVSLDSCYAFTNIFQGYCANKGTCIIIMSWHRCKPFNQWQRSFHMKTALPLNGHATALITGSTSCFVPTLITSWRTYLVINVFVLFFISFDNKSVILFTVSTINCQVDLH